jgi:dienelactone hydrolase
MAARSREVLTGVQVARLLVAAPRLLASPRARGDHVVVDVPGWQAPEATGAPLRAFLRRLGYDARAWGLGTNLGDPEKDRDRLAERVLRWADDHGPVSLVGWSLGGVISREVARKHPDAVRRVITYGTPVVGGPSFTVVASSYGEEECRRITEISAAHDRANPIQVPVTAIFTKRDGIVAWEACLDHTTPDVEHVEVGSTHLGLGIDPDVWALVADRLARD